MSSNDFFKQTGPTVVLTAALVAPGAVQAVASFDPGSQQYLVTNSGAFIAFLGVGANAQEAQARAVSGIPVLTLQQRIVSGPQNAWFSGTTVSNTASVALYITPGYGR